MSYITLENLRKFQGEVLSWRTSLPTLDKHNTPDIVRASASTELGELHTAIKDYGYLSVQALEEHSDPLILGLQLLPQEFLPTVIDRMSCLAQQGQHVDTHTLVEMPLASHEDVSACMGTLLHFSVLAGVDPLQLGTIKLDYNMKRFLPRFFTPPIPYTEGYNQAKTKERAEQLKERFLFPPLYDYLSCLQRAGVYRL